MPRVPRVDSEEGRRLYREYVVETTKQYVGYSFLALGFFGFFAYRILIPGPPNKNVLIGIAMIFGIGLITHLSRRATKEAAKYKLEQKRRFPPPPIESQVAGSRPNEVSTGDYTIRFDEEESKRDS